VVVGKKVASSTGRSNSERRTHWKRARRKKVGGGGSNNLDMPRRYVLNRKTPKITRKKGEGDIKLGKRAGTGDKRRTNWKKGTNNTRIGKQEVAGGEVSKQKENSGLDEVWEQLNRDSGCKKGAAQDLEKILQRGGETR